MFFFRSPLYFFFRNGLSPFRPHSVLCRTQSPFVDSHYRINRLIPSLPSIPNSSSSYLVQLAVIDSAPSSFHSNQTFQTWPIWHLVSLLWKCPAQVFGCYGRIQHNKRSPFCCKEDSNYTTVLQECSVQFQ